MHVRRYADVFPGAPANGNLRRAVEADLAFLVEWIEAFARETGSLVVDSRAKAAELIRDESIYVWDDGEPRSMVAVAATTPHGARVAYVYTPAPFRGRGYATIAVASLSDRLLQGGRRFCFLYTDLSNPISNAIYGRTGYEPVCDVVDVNFSSPGPRPAD
ncbi:MAG: GNAT family N-acetyltransferase [Candidatus Binatia bacterium]